MSGRSLALSVALLAIAWVLLGPAGLHPAPPPGKLCVQQLDVGQGDSILLSLPRGERILVDGGGVPGSRYDVGLRRVVPALRRAGVHRLDAVVATHGDADHIQGLFGVLEEIEVAALVVASRRAMRPGLRSLVAAAERRGVPVHAVDEEPPEGLGKAPARLIWHHPRVASSSWAENDRSVVFTAQLGEVGALLTGDIEAVGEALVVAQGIPRAAILKVPHHGSRTSSSDALLDAADPLVAVAGVGDGNRYGFPHASTRSRYLQRDVALYWTGRDGSVRACTDGWTIDVEALDERGRATSLRRVSAEEVSAWVDAARPPAVPVLSPELLAGLSPQPKRSKKRRRSKRARADRRRAEKGGTAASQPAAAPTPPEPTPELMDDAAWRKHRKRRGKLRAPWRSSGGR